MTEDRPKQNTRQSFSPGEGPKLLGQMLASGAEVFGSDGEKVGDLKDVDEAEFTVSRGLKRDLRFPVTSVGEVSGSDRVVLEFAADEAEDASQKGPDSAGKADDFSESPVREGLGEIFKGRNRKRGQDSEG